METRATSERNIGGTSSVMFFSVKSAACVVTLVMRVIEVGSWCFTFATVLLLVLL